MGSFGTPEYVLPADRHTAGVLAKKITLYRGPSSYLLFLKSLRGLFSHICLYFPIISALCLHERPGRAAGPFHIKPGAVPLPQGSVWTVRFGASPNPPRVPTRRLQVPPKFLLAFFPTGDEPKSFSQLPPARFQPSLSSPASPGRLPWRNHKERSPKTLPKLRKSRSSRPLIWCAGKNNSSG